MAVRRKPGRAGRPARSQTPYSESGALDATYARRVAQSAGNIQSTLESVVIPHLILKQRVVESRQSNYAYKLNEGDDISDRAPKDLVGFLMGFLLKDDKDGAERFVTDLLSNGYDPDTLVLDVLAPAATQLGERWEDDLSSFTDVTIAMGVLFHLLRQTDLTLARRSSLSGRVDGTSTVYDGSALLIAPPEEQHVFGLQIMASCLRRRQWRVQVLVGDGARAAPEEVQSAHYDLIGISCSSHGGRKNLKPFVRKIKKLNQNPESKVLLGGYYVNTEDELAEDVGADFVLREGRDIFNVAETLENSLRQGNG